MTETVSVRLGARSYDIVIGRGLIHEAGDRCLTFTPNRRAAVVTDETVAAHWLTPLREALTAQGIDATEIILPAGETTKRWEMLERTVEALLAARIERADPVIALGGGVIGDLTGFAAAITRRGIPFIQIPTTLLAQVDSSVGGKTGINSPLGKNLVGAFHQPRQVLIDTAALDTLPPREFLSGYAEVAKYGLLGDAAFFEWLQAHGPAAARGDEAARVYAIKRSCEMKAEIVARDETEKGDRALLNLGHTFGHALEAATGYSDRLLHGEGVAIGMALAFDMSARMGLCSQETPVRVRAHLTAMGMKARLADIPGDLPDSDRLLSLMAQDKKVEGGALTFILARGIGEAFVMKNADPAPARAVLEAALRERNA